MISVDYITNALEHSKVWLPFFWYTLCSHQIRAVCQIRRSYKNDQNMFFRLLFIAWHEKYNPRDGMLPSNRMAAILNQAWLQSKVKKSEPKIKFCRRANQKTPYVILYWFSFRIILCIYTLWYSRAQTFYSTAKMLGRMSKPLKVDLREDCKANFGGNVLQG